MKRLLLLLFVFIIPVCAMAQTRFTKPEVKKVMQEVADWQINNFKRYSAANWVNGALYVGMSDWAAMAEELDGNDGYFKFLDKIGQRTGWQPEKKMYHADDVCVCQMYIDMYLKYKDGRMINPTIARTDWVMAYPSRGSMEFDNKDHTTSEHWSWCDALFMAPPVYAKLYVMTKDKRYIKFMNREFKMTYDRLFNEEESLFYRDRNFIGQKEKNGKEMFWSRGNGWVMGGLAEILQILPENDRNRKYYEQLFIRMAHRIAALQCADGSWHASLLDPESFPVPESSGTGFFVYALAYGVNAGLLPAGEFLPAIERGWKTLVAAVHEDGKLGYVQPVGASPRSVTRDMTEAYGVGVFLLAGRQIYMMSE